MMDQYQEMIDKILKQPYTMEFCYHCGTKNQNVEENEICDNCGKNISLLVDEFNEKINNYCHGCGEKINETDDYCIACGRDTEWYPTDILYLFMQILAQEGNKDDALEIGIKAINYPGGHYQKFVIAGFMKSIYGDLLEEKFESINPNLSFAQIPDRFLNDDITKNVLKYSQVAIEEYDQLPSKQRKILEKDSLFMKMVQELKMICYELPIELAKRGLIENSENLKATQNTSQYSYQNKSFQGSKGVLLIWGSLTFLAFIGVFSGWEGSLVSFIVFALITFLYWRAKTKK